MYVCMYVCMYACTTQRLQEEAKLDQDLQEASAVESKEKRSKMVRGVTAMVCCVYMYVCAFAAN